MSLITMCSNNGLGFHCSTTMTKVVQVSCLLGKTDKQSWTAHSAKTTAFWDIVPCILVAVSETSGFFNETTRRYVPEDLRTRLRENLKCRMAHQVFFADARPWWYERTIDVEVWRNNWADGLRIDAAQAFIPSPIPCSSTNYGYCDRTDKKRRFRKWSIVGYWERAFLRCLQGSALSHSKQVLHPRKEVKGKKIKSLQRRLVSQEEDSTLEGKVSLKFIT
jgi:hypothetical protein